MVESGDGFDIENRNWGVLEWVEIRGRSMKASNIILKSHLSNWLSMFIVQEVNRILDLICIFLFFLAYFDVVLLGFPFDFPLPLTIPSPSLPVLLLPILLVRFGGRRCLLPSIPPPFLAIVDAGGGRRRGAVTTIFELMSANMDGSIPLALSDSMILR